MNSNHSPWLRPCNPRTMEKPPLWACSTNLELRPLTRTSSRAVSCRCTRVETRPRCDGRHLPRELRRSLLDTPVLCPMPAIAPGRTPARLTTVNLSAVWVRHSSRTPAPANRVTRAISLSQGGYPRRWTFIPHSARNPRLSPRRQNRMRTPTRCPKYDSQTSGT